MAGRICGHLRGSNGKEVHPTHFDVVWPSLDHNLLYSALCHLSPKRVPLDRLAVGTEALWVPGSALCLHEAC
jgi:hypothetical protein